MYRAEYPRPNFIRESWSNLNGEWGFEICPDDSSYLNKSLSGTIQVPFCPESSLSGVGKTQFMNNLWYRKTFNIDTKKLEGKVIIHFGAVDYKCTLYINGNKVGNHQGGYIGFEFDITNYLKEGCNVIDLSVFDDSTNYAIPSGKQSNKPESYSCFYTRTSGIWQTVWLEYVNNNYIKNCKITADVDSKTVSFSGFVCKPCKMKIDVSYHNTPQSTCTFDIDAAFNLNIPLDQIVLWNILEPQLYDIKLTLLSGNTSIDEVSTYTAFRKMEIKDNKLLLNNNPIFLAQVLDQGFYLDGIYTAKSVEEIYNDIDIAIEFGFNGSRPHQKVMEEHYLYYADQKGFLLWGEYPSWNCNFTQNNINGYNNMINEWTEAVNRDYNHPSIIGWCPLNEAWPWTNNKCDKSSQENIVKLTKKLDPTRPVIGASGGTIFSGDICD